MKKAIYALFSIALYIGVAIILGYVIVISPKLITKYYIMDTMTIMKMGILIFMFMSIATVLMLDVVEKAEWCKKIKNGYFVILAVTYSIFLSYNLFLTNHTIDFVNNFIPFKNIAMCIYGSLAMDEFVSTALIDIFYYTLIFVPAGILLYLCNNKFKKFNNYFATMGVMIVLTMTIQCIVGTNSFDVDKMILSVFGSVLTYIVVNSFQNYRVSGKCDCNT